MNDPNLHNEWRRARRILVVRLDAMGDVLMTSPAFRAIKQTSGAEMTLLTSRSGAAIANFIPEIDSTIVFEAPWMPAQPGSTGATRLEQLDAVVERIASERFDAAIVFTVFTQSPLPAAMLLFEAGIPLQAAHCRENPYSLLTNWIQDRDASTNVAHVRHEVRRQLDLVESLGFAVEDECLSVQVSDEDRRAVLTLLDREGLSQDDAWVVLHPGATAPSRRYSMEKYAKVAYGLAHSGIRVVVTGSASESVLTSRIAQECRGIDLAGKLSLGQLLALIAEAPLLVSNNTGPVHIAAAVGTPVVDLYALTNPQHTPWHVPHVQLSADVECKYCFKSVCPEGHHKCLDLIEPEQVVAATQTLIHDTRNYKFEHTHATEHLLIDDAAAAYTYSTPHSSSLSQ